MRRRSISPHFRACAVAAAAATSFAVAQATLFAWQAQQGCRVSGRATSGGRALPGVALVVKSGDRIVAATSTEIDGTYRVSLPPNATYQLGAELTAFAPVAREITIGPLPCADTTADLTFTLASRVPGAARSAGAPTPAPVTTPAPGAAGRGTAAGPGAATGSGQQRFEALAVQTGATAAAALEVNPPEREAQEAATRLLLPPGFSMEGPTEAVAMNGNMASVDRGMLNDRL